LAGTFCFPVFSVVVVLLLCDFGSLDNGSSVLSSASRDGADAVARVTVLITSVLANCTGLAGSLALGGDNT